MTKILNKGAESMALSEPWSFIGKRLLGSVSGQPWVALWLLQSCDDACGLYLYWEDAPVSHAFPPWAT